MPMTVLAEAILRVEHKLDVLLRHVLLPHLKAPAPMHFVGQSCPICRKEIDYVVDVSKNIVCRKCGCSTGKQPSLIPLVPVQPPQGAVDAVRKPDQSTDDSGTEDSDQRKIR